MHIKRKEASSPIVLWYDAQRFKIPIYACTCVCSKETKWKKVSYGIRR